MPTPTLRTSAATLDYYLLRPPGGADAPADAPAVGLLVEEFVLAGDLSAERLRGAAWTTPQGWWSSALFARQIRTDAALLGRLTMVDRAGAEAAFLQLAGVPLPTEDELRGHFHDDVPLASGPPLSFGAGAVVHRVLFAGRPGAEQVDGLRRILRLDAVTGPDAGGPGVVGTGRFRVNDTDVRWTLRRVGGLAWAIDVAAEPDDDVAALRWVLRQVTGVARRYGLIPATVERFG